MKAKTFLELMTLSTNLYMLTKDEELMNKLKNMVEQGKDKINHLVSDPVHDADGTELEFVDKLILKAHEAKEEMNQKIGEMVADLYQKMNIAHTEQIKGLQAQIEELNKALALAEARLNHLENKSE
jgi:polyhydroxyalkanoate synthesis regulator phasin